MLSLIPIHLRDSYNIDCCDIPFCFISMHPDTDILDEQTLFTLHPILHSDIIKVTNVNYRKQKNCKSVHIIPSPICFGSSSANTQECQHSIYFNPFLVPIWVNHSKCTANEHMEFLKYFAENTTHILLHIGTVKIATNWRAEIKL